MDERVVRLKAAFPEVFERSVGLIDELEDDFVRIDVPIRLRFSGDESGELEGSGAASKISGHEGNLLGDLEHWEPASVAIPEARTLSGSDSALDRVRQKLVSRRRSDVLERLRKRIGENFQEARPA